MIRIYGVERLRRGSIPHPRGNTTPTRHRNTRLTFSLPKPVFLGMEHLLPAGLLQILLIRAGIEPNPGPRNVWICAVCQRERFDKTKRGKGWVPCAKCGCWVHANCAGINPKDWQAAFIAPCCRAQPQPAVPQPAPMPPTSPNAPIQPQPVPTPAQPAPNRRPPLLPNPMVQVVSIEQSFKILQLNINGLGSKLAELMDFLHQNSIMVACIQETKLSPKSSLKDGDLGDYSIIRRDRPGGRGGGIAFLVHKSVHHAAATLPLPPPNDNSLEQQAITIKSGNSHITLVNLYIPPNSSCPAGYSASVAHLMGLPDCIIVGDFNAHDDLWFSGANPDLRGSELALEFNNSHFGILNNEHHTRQSGATLTSPDISLASASLLPFLDWEVRPTLHSDHLPIIIHVEKTVEMLQSEKKYFVNFRKADWPGFTSFCEEKFSKEPPPPNAVAGERVFSGIIRAAARRHIPQGRIPTVRPNFPNSAATLAKARDKARLEGADPAIIAAMNAQIRRQVHEHSRDKWRETVEKCDLRSGASQLFKLVKNLVNPRPKMDNVAISFNGKSVSHPKGCADNFNKQFTPSNRPQGDIKLRRKTMRKIRKLEKDFVPFQPGDIVCAIKSTKSSKAIGPDGISPIMLKHLGAIATGFLTSLLNLSFQDFSFPRNWKVAKVIPLPKPGKPAGEGASYRPISILSPVAKLAEKLMLPQLHQHINLAPHQHGFRKDHSTTTALHQISHQITQGLNRSKPCHRTVLVALDLSKAFDTVSHDILLDDILHTTMPNWCKRWIAGYLHDRQTYVVFRGVRSRRRKMRQGVPQGGVLSPILFNLYMSKLPNPPAGVSIVSYADDCSILATGPIPPLNPQPLCDRINPYLDSLSQWFTSRSLQISAPKSSATLFSTWNKEMATQLDIHIENNLIPTAKQPKILGVTFDCLHTFAHHATDINRRIRKRTNAVKCLSGTSWGANTEVLLTTYKTVCRPIINYAVPIWHPGLSKSRRDDLQVAQNQALRSATGCHLKAPIDHLHHETRVLPVEAHNDLLCNQYLLRCHLPTHPSNQLLADPPAPRHLKKGILSYKPFISHQIPANGLDPVSYRRGLKALHRRAVDDAVRGYLPSVVLGGYPPPHVNPMEVRLPRETRCALSQLRSGYSKRLNDYWAKIRPGTPNVCPSCAGSPHDVAHLFNCPTSPTTLQVIDLWNQPDKVATFLGLPVEEEEE